VGDRCGGVPVSGPKYSIVYTSSSLLLFLTVLYITLHSFHPFIFKKKVRKERKREREEQPEID
jgi:hypothetical protein